MPAFEVPPFWVEWLVEPKDLVVAAGRVIVADLAAEAVVEDAVFATWTLVLDATAAVSVSALAWLEIPVANWPIAAADAPAVRPRNPRVRSAFWNGLRFGVASTSARS